jgi:hypothetical protein
VEDFQFELLENGLDFIASGLDHIVRATTKADLKYGVPPSLRHRTSPKRKASPRRLDAAPHDVAREILRGGRSDKMKDQQGKRMTDAYLILKLAPEHPWLPDVYERTSGYIHFSGAHMFSPIAEVRKESREVEYVISETDTNYPESS